MSIEFAFTLSQCFRKLTLVCFLAVSLSACSRPLHWEEEVPLNIGETIWVRRTVMYSIRGDAGNPLDLAYRPARDAVIEFTWNGRSYRYEGDARIMLLAISPRDKRPVLVARAADNAWYAQHHYPCTTPFYVQLEPDHTGKVWAWPSKVEPWLYGLESNLLLARHSIDKMKPRYGAEERQAENRAGAVGAPSKQRVDPDLVGDMCRNKEK